MSVTLMQGDCLIRMAEIPDGSVDMILADLPYGTTACKWDNVIPFEPLWKHYWRVVKPNGAVVLFGSEPFSSHLRMSQIKHYKYDWVWVKDKATGHLNCKNAPLKQTEYISVFGVKKCNYFPQLIRKEEKNIRKYRTLRKDIDIYAGGSKKSIPTIPIELGYPKNILKFNSCLENGDKGLHPTQKPVALLEYLIKTYTLEGETVLDNTMGSGSTGVACVNTGRSFIGIEQDDKYFAIAQQRIAEAQTPKELWS